MRDVGWDTGDWLNTPPAVRIEGGELVVTTAQESDFWRTTSYGFVHDSGHALLVPFAGGSAVEVGFVADFTRLYDQAGVLVHVDSTTWLKAGIELTDGELHVGAVATNGVSDWSLAPVPDWAGREVTVRVSRSGDALTVRARVEEQPWRMIRLAPLAPDALASAGPLCCSPTHADLRVRFTRFAIGDADAALHA